MRTSFVITLLLALGTIDSSAQSGIRALPSSAPPDGMRTAFQIPLFSISVPLGSNRSGVRIGRRAWLEIGAVALTGVGHLAFSAAGASEYFIPLATGAWGSYVYYRVRTEADFLRTVGFRRKRMGPAFRDASLIGAGSLAVMAGIGASRGSLRLSPDMAPLLILYPIWGLVQQFLVQGFLTRHLSHGGIASSYVVTPISASAFAAVHVPSWELVVGTYALGLGFTPHYLQHRNLWPLGLYHGWLGTFYYYWVLDRDPWRSVSG